MICYYGLYLFIIEEPQKPTLTDKLIYPNTYTIYIYIYMSLCACMYVCIHACIYFTWSEVVCCRKSSSLQFTIRNKFYPKIAATRSDIWWILLTTVASDDWREAKRPVPNFNVIKFAFP